MNSNIKKQCITETCQLASLHPCLGIRSACRCYSTLYHLWIEKHCLLPIICLTDSPVIFEVRNVLCTELTLTQLYAGTPTSQN